MSWALQVMPLHLAAADGVIDWAADIDPSLALPEEPSVARELPTVAQVLSAFREAGCHGVSWSRVAGHDPVRDLPGCPAPATCASTGGPDLGEVSLGVDGADGDEPVGLDRPVRDVRFRKPSGTAVLAAAVALAARAGPLLVFDDGMEHLFVVSPGDEPADLARRWPW
ncbi:hypothetical protein [Micromonospora sp. WMMA2032]|uniref:hypothetical protein n=1 Tax=Micromonospora sp. WMMA2032 TaxID=2039870 RepID=UPI0012FD4416|nr:hypothetical protein [Micromonospora sp. WMMA2032]